MKQRWFLFIALLLCWTTLLYSFGSPPTFNKKKDKKPPVTIVPEVESTTEQAPAEELLTDEVLETKREFAKAIKKNQLQKATKLIEEIPIPTLTDTEKKQKKWLVIFEEVERIVSENESQFRKEDTLEPDVKRTVGRLYKASQVALIDEEKELAEDLLIQSIFLDRQNSKSKKLLELGLDKPIGTYKVENVEAKYWKVSWIHHLSGYPDLAVKDLRVLEAFDPENSLIFERMGSSYYTMGKTKEAVQSWERALYLNPDKKDLKDFIKNAKVEMERQDKATKAILNRKKEKKSDVKDELDYQLLSMLTDSNKAYSFAQKAREQNPDAKVIVEETPEGKYAVKIGRPKKKESEQKND